MPSCMQRKAVRMVIHGIVQGVGFRWWARGEARRRGLSGWVRNRQDGSVELLAIGDADGVEQLVRLCRHGPSAARVSKVDLQDAEDDGSAAFEARQTA